MSTEPKNEQLLSRLEAPMSVEEMTLAFARWQGARSALPADAVLTISADVRTVVSIVGAALPKIARAVPELPRLPGFGRRALEEVRELNAALLHADILFAQREVEDSALTARRALVAEGLTLRAQLMAQVDLFEKLGLLGPRPAIERVVTRSRRARLEDDLSRLVGTLRGLDEALKARMTVEDRALDRAMAMQEDLGHAIRLGTARPWRTQNAKAVAEERARAFTLVLDRYGHLGVAVAYLRWDEGDADELVPSLYTRSARPSRRPKRTASPAKRPAADAPATAAPSETPLAPASHDA